MRECSGTAWNDGIADRDRRLLDSMVSGTVYEVREMATATGFSMSTVRHILERLRKSGQVTRIEPVWQGLPVQWRRG